VKPSYQEMGLTPEEYRRIRELLGRRPNFTETGIFAVMWSEHCSYKHSKKLLRLFPTTGPQVLQGPGENAGVVDIGDGWAVAFKMESHNHPSAVEPFQGAATGVGGIVRDIFTMGARPVALLDSLRFGRLDSARARYLFNKVVEGISWYGNCLGIPTVGGETVFDDAYAENPLVNVFCAGLLRHEDLARGVARGVGNPVMVVGARTGRDGIHGATFASEELSETSASRRPAVQVGDPFMEKLLLEACLELIHGEHILGIQDMGAAGLTSSAVEMASRAQNGLDLDVSLVPRREPGMTPYEVLLSESQERMLLVPSPGSEAKVQEVFERWGLMAVTVGRVTDDGIFRVRDGKEVVAEIPVKALTDLCPVYNPPETRPAYLDKVNGQIPAFPEPRDYGKSLLSLLADPNLAAKEWIYRQYDHQVQVNTVTGPGSDAAVLRIKGTAKALALTVDCNGRYTYLDPYTGGAQAVAEAARNLAVTGAKPLAITDCLNFGSPEKPEVYWQMSQAVAGMSRACRVLGTPVVGGNVSLYNESEGRPVFPTPVVGMVGLLEDAGKRVPMGLKRPGSSLCLLGDSPGYLGGSRYLYQVLGREAGPPPPVNLEAEAALIRLLLQGRAENLFLSAHDLGEGGLACALAESALAGKMGLEVELFGEARADALLFGEDQGRALVEVKEADLPRLKELGDALGVPCRRIGLSGGEKVIIKQNGKIIIELLLDLLAHAYREAIPCLMD